MIRNAGIAAKLIILILLSTMTIFTVAFTYNYAVSKRIVLKKVKNDAGNLTLATVYRIESVMTSVASVPNNMAGILESRSHSRDELNALLRSVIEHNSSIYGSAIAFEPYAFDPDRYYFAPYACRDNGKPKLLFLGDTYRYPSWDWYQIPRETHQAVWTEPYYDEGGGDIIMATYAVPFYRHRDGQRQCIGVVTADLSLLWLQDIISAVSIYTTGYAFLISANGTIVTHPDRNLIMHESIFSIAEARNDQGLRTVGRDMVRRGRGFVPITDFYSGKKAWMYYAALPSAGWSIGVVIPEDELLADLRILTNKVFIIGLAGFLVLVIVIAFIAGTITRPLRTLARTTIEIARGNLDIELPEWPSNDEIGQLSRSFENMKTALKDYIANLAETTAAKERIESELKIAATIQRSFLPKRFPPFPERTEFELYATLEPAKEVGGDLYDFFMLDDEHLFFSIGDVSGKGVPAALFMAVTKTLMKGLAAPGLPPHEVLARVNAELCIDNESSMFATVICAVLNLKTGRVAYSNAGHNPPLLLKRNRPPAWLALPPGLVLGGLDAAHYTTAEIILDPGDMLLLYTDGVTEAMDTRRQLYSEQRLITVAAEASRTSPRNMVSCILDSVQRHSAGEPQSDDITILSVLYKGAAT